jgi:hypothetical protein
LFGLDLDEAGRAIWTQKGDRGGRKKKEEMDEGVREGRRNNEELDEGVEVKEKNVKSRWTKLSTSEQKRMQEVYLSICFIKFCMLHIESREALWTNVQKKNNCPQKYTQP